MIYIQFPNHLNDDVIKYSIKYLILCQKYQFDFLNLQPMKTFDTRW